MNSFRENVSIVCFYTVIVSPQSARVLRLKENRRFKKYDKDVFEKQKISSKMDS
jgi:hypothetical protein